MRQEGESAASGCKRNTGMSKSLSRMDLIQAMQKELKYSRFIHTLGVAFTATSLAECHGVDMRRAETAGILHDCAKCIDVSRMEQLCEKAGYALSPMERGNGALLHSKAGCILARDKYGIEDPEILNAIACHTTGKPAMTQLEKIIFIADYIEPGRESAPHLDEIRAAAFEDLDKALRMILKDTLEYLHEGEKPIDEMTQRTYDYYHERQ